MLRFLQKILALMLAVILLVACGTMRSAESQSLQATPVNANANTKSALPVAYRDQELRAFPAKLAPLPYDYTALSRAIDAETMKLHHGAHHASYVKNLNDALKDAPELQKKSVEAILRDLNSVPEKIRTKVQNNGGGHLNHTIFWQIMSPNGGGEPTGELAKEINQTFGSFDAFKKEFNAAGASRFGSGWVWLVRNAQGKLEIMTTANQDNPIMEGLYPIMGNDVWEHAYYLKYRNRRPEYLNNWWNVVNWSEINKRASVREKLR